MLLVVSLLLVPAAVASADTFVTVQSTAIPLPLPTPPILQTPGVFIPLTIGIPTCPGGACVSREVVRVNIRTGHTLVIRRRLFARW